MTKRTIAVLSIALLFIGIMVPLTVGKADSVAAPQVSTTTRFRVVIAAPLTTAVDVYVDGVTSSVSGLTPAQPLNVSGYVITQAGSHTITLMQTGTSTTVGSPLTFTFTALTNYTFALLPDMTWITFTDNNVAPAAGSTNARVINVSPNNNPVSIVLDGAVPTDYASIAYKSASSSYLAITAGSHTLGVQNSTAKIITYDFQDGHVYTIFVFWNPTKNEPLIIPKSDTNFLVGTVVPTVGVTPNPTPNPNLTIHLYLPIAEK